MKRLTLFLILIAFKQILSAQQLPLYSQYIYNQFLINPAHAGSDGYASFNLTAREQWVGYDGSPKTYSLSFQARILKRGYKLKQNIFDRTVYRPKTTGKVGFGGYVFSDRNGLIQRTGFSGTYSYHMWVQDYTQLSFGLSLTGYHFIINANESSFDDPNEPWLNDYLRKGVFIPDADFGVYLLSPKYEVGFSSQQLFGSAAKIGKDAYKNFSMYRHYYLFGSYSYKVKVRTELVPSLLLKMSDQVRPQADLGFTYSYDRRYWAGVTYRTGGTLISNLRFKFAPSNVRLMTMYVGYSFDYALNKMHNATYGTHEVIIAVKLGDTAKRFRWIDRF